VGGSEKRQVSQQPPHLFEEEVSVHCVCCYCCHIWVLELQECVVLGLACLLAATHTHTQQATKLREEACFEHGTGGGAKGEGRGCISHCLYSTATGEGIPAIALLIVDAHTQQPTKLREEACVSTRRVVCVWGGVGG
jgi:hypothetical protein